MFAKFMNMFHYFFIVLFQLIIYYWLLSMTGSPVQSKNWVFRFILENNETPVDRLFHLHANHSILYVEYGEFHLDGILHIIAFAKLKQRLRWSAVRNLLRCDDIDSTRLTLPTVAYIRNLPNSKNFGQRVRCLSVYANKGCNGLYRLSQLLPHHPSNPRLYYSTIELPVPATPTPSITTTPNMLFPPNVVKASSSDTITDLSCVTLVNTSSSDTITYLSCETTAASSLSVS